MDITLYLLQWAALAGIFFLALMSPGPDFVVAVRNSIVHSRRIGIFTALGFALGVLIHIAYAVIGIAAIISQSILLFNIIKYAGAAYIIYLGFQALRSKGMGKKAVDNALSQKAKRKMTDLKALRSGFITNVLNPKASLFFLAIFTQVVEPTTPILWQITYGVSFAIMTFFWFALVATVLTQGPVRNLFLKATKWIDRVCGSVLIALGIKVATTAN